MKMMLSDSQCMLDIIAIVKLNVILENIQFPVLSITTTLLKHCVKTFLKLKVLIKIVPTIVDITNIPPKFSSLSTYRYVED